MFTVSTCTLKTSTFQAERCRGTRTNLHVCPQFRLNYGLRVKRERERQEERKNERKRAKTPARRSVLVRVCSGPAASSSRSFSKLKAQEPALPCRTVPGAILHTDPRSFTSHTKHPVSANHAEVLVSPANECVWCQRAVLRPGSPSV